MMQAKRQHRMGTWLLCLCFFFPLTTHAQTTAKEWGEQGYAKLFKGDYDGAIADYSHAIELDPKYAHAYAGRGWAGKSKGNLAAAAKDLNRAIELDPNDQYAYASRGALRYDQDDFKGALADYDRAIKLDPAYAWVYARRGVLRWEQDDVADALADLTRAIELDPKSSYAYGRRGNVRRDRGEYANAIADFTRAIELNPKDDYAYYRRGLAQSSLGRLDAAIADYNRALELNPKKVGGFYNRGIARHNKHDYRGAIADYSRAIELKPEHVNAHLNRGLARAWLGQTEAAIADYTRVIDLNPEKTSAFEYRARARTKKGDYDGAFLDYTRAGELDPDNKPHYLHLQGDVRFKQHRFAEAYDCISLALPGLKKTAQATGNSSNYKHAMAVRFLSAWLSGKLNQFKPEELLGMMREQFDFLGVLAWIVPIGLVFVLAGLVGWTYGTRNRGPGLWLSCTWIVVMLLASGIGFQLSLPGLNHMVERWLGAILVSLACFIAVWIIGHERYLGTRPRLTNYKAWLGAAGLLVGLMVIVLVLDSGYDAIYEHISGHKLEAQLAKFLMHCDTPRQLVFTVLVAGLLIPFYEEVLFRGFLFDALGRRWGTGWALGLTSVIFAVAHGLAIAPALLVFALIVGWLRIRTGNLRLSILLHGLNNSLAIIALYFEKA